MKINEITSPRQTKLKNIWKPNETAYYEYHCYQGHDSADAQLWYRSHQPVVVLGISERGYGNTAIARTNNGEPRIYQVQFKDGHVGDVFEDELFTDPRYCQTEFCPPPENERRL